MITKFEVNKYLGLDSWTALFFWIQEKDPTRAEIVRIAFTNNGTPVVCPIKVPLHLAADDIVWTVPVQHVKANAFDEIFNRLPTAQSVLVIQELVGEIALRAEVTGEHIHTFLNNIPTRKQ